VAAAPAAGACGPPKGDVASHQLDADAEQLAGDGGEDAAAADAAAADAAAAAAERAQGAAGAGLWSTIKHSVTEAAHVVSAVGSSLVAAGAAAATGVTPGGSSEEGSEVQEEDGEEAGGPPMHTGWCCGWCWLVACWLAAAARVHSEAEPRRRACCARAVAPQARSHPETQVQALPRLQRLAAPPG
jgi:hypothetical protein